MQKFNTLDDAIRLAKFIHHKQVDKLGEPYFGHVYRVYRNVAAQGASIDVQIAAVLHDSTEDSKFTPQMLLDIGVPEAAVNMVRLVDRGASKLEYDEQRKAGNITCTKDEFYYSAIRLHPGALTVKLADIADNLQPWRLSCLPQSKQDYLRDKYDKAIRLLTR